MFNKKCLKWFNYWEKGSFICIDKMQVDDKHALRFGDKHFVIWKTNTNHLVFEEVKEKEKNVI